MKWKILLPLFMSVGRMMATSLREQDANNVGADDEAADAIDDAITHVEKFIAKRST